MTTSDLRSALRRALMMLESSLLSGGGLPPSPIDELATPEERLAARLVRRLSLQPPVDVYKLARSLASVSEKQFPIEIDGLCLDLKVPGRRPKIWLSKRPGLMRRRFTLAHEIGHIVIPWHTGTIVDDLEAPRTASGGSYRQIEAEANRFAAELLMPTHWTINLGQRAEHIADMMHAIVHVAEVSFPSALIRVEQLGPPGYVGAEIREGVVVWSGRTKGTAARPPLVGTQLEHIEMPTAEEPRVLSRELNRYYWWKLRDTVNAPSDPMQPWREILERMLRVVPFEHRVRTQNRVNAVIGVAIGKAPKGAPVDEIYRHGLEASQNRADRDQWLAAVIAHPDYKDYVLARAYERSSAA